eukprot:1966271-Amphidinium_carterae.1
MACVVHKLRSAQRGSDLHVCMPAAANIDKDKGVAGAGDLFRETCASIRRKPAGFKSTIDHAV